MNTFGIFKILDADSEKTHYAGDLKAGQGVLRQDALHLPCYDSLEHRFYFVKMTARGNVSTFSLPRITGRLVQLTQVQVKKF